MGKNIALLFDGTWNEPSASKDPEESTDTNVRRFYESIRAQADDGTRQERWYNEGVGTEWMNRVRGGAIGYRLDEHIIQGYEKLLELYKTGDRIYLLGFSRGAYTARSLVGLVRMAGLLRSPGKPSVRDAYDFYRSHDKGPNSRAAQEFRAANSTEVDIHFVGVWDTVGALGIPLNVFKDFNTERYGFHDPKLSRIVRNAFHAMALDEHRGPYAVTMWGPQSPDDAEQRLEQVWFAGAHADVGGGYVAQPLSNPPLRWMQRRAIECGLAVDVLPEADDPEARRREYLAPAHDSFAEFLNGSYTKIGERYYRPVGRTGDGMQVLHPSLLKRLIEIEQFRPVNDGLAAMLVRRTVSAD
jgi:uncharacterized protein (DUF2235 family)